MSELFKVHKLPAAEKGYELTHELIEELVHQVGLSERDNGILVNLGKLRQGTLSARFRVNDNRAEAEENARKAVESIEEILRAVGS